MAIDPKRVKEIFLEAAELPDEAARAACLDKTCGGDAGLRARVEALLRSHDPEGSFLDEPAAVVPGPDHGSAQTFAGNADHAVASDTEPAPTEALSSAPDAAPASHGSTAADTEEEPLTFLAPPQRPDSLGRIEHYEVLQILGKGGFGIVFRAFDEMLQRVVALKVMAPQLAATSPARKRFLREARSSAQVRHENVVQVYEVAEQPLPYLSMEFIPGETLQQKLDRVGPLDVPETLRIGRQIAEGLAAAHATDLIHRDIKPGNVLLEGGQHKVKITDFGLARAADDASISQSGIIAGTPMYMAPEQALGNKLDQRADLFSLGSVLYQMVAGRPPFRANTTLAVLKRVAEDTPRDIREIIPETPQWLCDIIAKLHAKNPDDRYQSAREVADVLADCEAQLKANAKLKDYSRIPRSQPRRSGRRRWLVAAAAVLLPVMALAATEYAGVTHIFRGHATTDTSQFGGATPSKMSKSGVAESAGWVQLFNGKDLTGWKVHPTGTTGWTVENGAITPIDKGMRYLFSERGDYANFHCRAEVKLNRGDSGIYFRAPFGPSFPQGYEAQLQEPSDSRPGDNTGALYNHGPADHTVVARSFGSQVSGTTWFTLEIIANGDHITTKINGKTAVDYVEAWRPHVQGHFALQTFGNQRTDVQFRKIEIKELPPVPSGTPSPEAKSPPPAVAPFTGPDVQRIAALPAEQQVEEVRKELMRRNPGYDGKMETKIEDGVVTEFRIVTDHVTDIAPIRVWSALRLLECRGTRTKLKPDGLLADLTPLAGMNLAGLTHLDLTDTKVTDAGLVYFKDCKDLTYLDLHNTKVTDAGMVYFKGCKNLTSLYLYYTQVGDAGLLPFQDCKALMHLHLDGTQASNAGLAHFKGTPLMRLWIQDTGITDLTPLQGMPLEDIRLTPKNITKSLSILRDMKSLKTIGISWEQAWPAAEFWQRYDRGEFK
jgi:serine/threonine protein kinase